jgi:hypothetical protein
MTMMGRIYSFFCFIIFLFLVSGNLFEDMVHIEKMSSSEN